MPFGLASSQCAAVAQARIVRLHPTPTRDIPCSRARAGPLRDAARHRPPEKNHSHVSRVRHAPPLPRGWALTSFCPTPLSVAAPAHLSRSPRTAGPLFQNQLRPRRLPQGTRAPWRPSKGRQSELQSVHTADVRAEESTVNNYGVLGFLCVSDALFCTHVNSSWYN